MRRPFKQTINLDGCDAGGPASIQFIDNICSLVHEPSGFASIPATNGSLFWIIRLA